jgi:hypothetical protein
MTSRMVMRTPPTTNATVPPTRNRIRGLGRPIFSSTARSVSRMVTW